MKISTIIVFGILILGLIGVTYSLQNQDNELDFNGLKINSKDYKAITEPLPEGRFVLCSIKDNKCNLMFKGELD